MSHPYKTAYLPQNLDLEAFLNENKPVFGYHIDNFKYMLGLINEIPAYNKEIREENEYVPLNAAMLRIKGIHDYRKYLDYLINLSIIETDNRYIKGEKSRGYKFTLQYQTPLKPESIEKFTLLKQLNKITKSQQRMDKRYRYLKKWFNDDLHIDMAGAEAYLMEEFKRNTKLGVANSLLMYNSGYINAHRLSTQNYSFKVDKNVHRLHTNLTNLKSELRNYISYGGQELVSVDICNSQPYLSSVLLDQNFWRSDSTGPNTMVLNIQDIKQSNTSFNGLTNPFPYSSFSSSPSHIMLAINDETQASSDVQKYITESAHGTLYEYIWDKIEQATGKKITDRRDLKGIIFTVLYSDNRFIGQIEAEPKRMFKDLFPNVYEVFSFIKREDSTILPRLLQNIEAHLMLDYVAKRITTENPNMPVFTIHDSIVVPIGYEDYVATVITEEMIRAIGIHPTLKYDYWESPKSS